MTFYEGIFLGFPWLADGITKDETLALDVIGRFVGTNEALAQVVLGLPWVDDGITLNETLALKTVGRFISLKYSTTNNALDQVVLGFPWLADGITEDEVHALDIIREFSWDNDALTQVLLGFPWLADADGITKDEMVALDIIGRFITKDDALAQVDSPWIADGITKDEALVLDIIGLGAKRAVTPVINHAVIQVIQDLPWVADGLTATEKQTLSNIRSFAKADSGIVYSVLNSPLFYGESRILHVGLLPSLEFIHHLSSQFEGSWFEQMFNQEWFQDGLSDEEAALIVVLRTDIGNEDTWEFSQDLIQGGRARSETVSLPSGEGTLFLIRRPSLGYADNSVFEWMSTGMEAIEDFAGTPWSSMQYEWLSLTGLGAFPGTPWMKNDAILYVVPGLSLEAVGSSGGRNYLSHITINIDPGSSSFKEVLYHELGHYYSYTGPKWLREGGAEFLASYTLHLSENVSLQSRYDLAQEGVANNCKGATNIQEWIDAPTPIIGVGADCAYPMGESFLLGMYLGLGHEVVLSSWGDLLERRQMTEDDIYQVFLSNTPPEKQDVFRDLYRRLHGGPIPDSDK